MSFIPSARFNPERIPCMGKEEDDLHLRRNYDICQGINITNLAVVLGRMKDSGDLHPYLYDAYMAQARGLLATILSENNRSLGF